MTVLKNVLLGGRVFTSAERVLEGLTLEVAAARVEGLPFTIYGLLWHLEITQDLLLRGLTEEGVRWPPAAEQWPGAQPTEEDLEDLVSRLRAGLYEASELAGDADLEAAPRDVLEKLVAHNAYHWGQVVVMRRLLGDWPSDAVNA